MSLNAKHEIDREQAVFSVFVFAFLAGCILETSIIPALLCTHTPILLKDLTCSQCFISWMPLEIRKVLFDACHRRLEKYCFAHASWESRQSFYTSAKCHLMHGTGDERSVIFYAFFVSCPTPCFQPLMFTGVLGRCQSRKQTGDITVLFFLTSSIPYKRPFALNKISTLSSRGLEKAKLVKQGRRSISPRF